MGLESRPSASVEFESGTFRIEKEGKGISFEGLLFSTVSFLKCILKSEKYENDKIYIVWQKKAIHKYIVRCT